MKEILETNQLEYEKTTFLIDLVKHNTGKLYIEIVQTIGELRDKKTQRLKLNPIVLPDLFSILEKYQERIENPLGTSKKFVYQQRQDQIIKRYFKGVSIKDLALQFGVDKDTIEYTIRNRGFEVVSNEMPKSRRSVWRKRK